ncbi:MAG: hypothetical protein EPN47_14585 [Acidobacteria bacterium]|nr:MAG: hypothetical protein EPN47_14585 [Acidobacteriota bacterium]
MGNRIHTTILSVLGVVFLFAGMAFARTIQINVLYPALVGKTLKLKPGNYRIEVVNSTNTAMVRFYSQGRKLVGEAPVKLVNKSHKNDLTMVDYSTMASNDHAITEISPKGLKENLYFSNPQSGVVHSKD